MKFILSALIDDETRKSIREMVLGEAKATARAEIDTAVKAEIQRIAATLNQQLHDRNNWRLVSIVTEAVRSILTVDYWNDKVRDEFESMLQAVVHGRLNKLIDQMVKDATDKIVAQKLRDKTVWEAKEQDAYVRRVVRSELGDALEDFKKLRAAMKKLSD